MKPLAKYAVLVKSIFSQCKKLTSKQSSQAGHPRIGWLGNNHIVFLFGQLKMRSSILNNKVRFGIRKHVIIPREKEVTGFDNLLIDVEDIELFDRIIQHLAGSYAACQTQYHNHFGPSVKEHRKMRTDCLRLHISP
ncbi:hypothetical protein ES703_92767 [subsurface metagenome]